MTSLVVGGGSETRPWFFETNKDLTQRHRATEISSVLFLILRFCEAIGNLILTNTNVVGADRLFVFVRIKFPIGLPLKAASDQKTLRLRVLCVKNLEFLL